MHIKIQGKWVFLYSKYIVLTRRKVLSKLILVFQMSPQLITLQAAFFKLLQVHIQFFIHFRKHRKDNSLKSKGIMPLISIHSEDSQGLKHRNAGPNQQALVTEINIVTPIFNSLKTKAQK